MPPELLNEGEYSTEGDIWQLGVIFYYLLMLDLPFHGENVKSVMRRIRNINFQEEFAEVNDEYELFKQLIPVTLNVDPI